MKGFVVLQNHSELEGARGTNPWNVKQHALTDTEVRRLMVRTSVVRSPDVVLLHHTAI